jgi:hypothetical protein
VAYSRLVKKNFTLFFGKAKVMEIVKCKNFEKEIIPEREIKKGRYRPFAMLLVFL